MHNLDQVVTALPSLCHRPRGCIQPGPAVLREKASLSSTRDQRHIASPEALNASRERVSFRVANRVLAGPALEFGELDHRLAMC